eukprot:511312-Amphidinium_carterae.1
MTECKKRKGSTGTELVSDSEMGIPQAKASWPREQLHPKRLLMMTPSRKLTWRSFVKSLGCH